MDSSGLLKEMQSSTKSVKLMFPKRGFGLKPNPTDYSPFALLGACSDLPKRSRFTFKYDFLIRQDDQEMVGNNTVLDDRYFKYAVKDAFNAFKLPESIVPIHLNDILNMDLDIRRSSPGIPWQPDYKTIGEVMDDIAARNSIRFYWHEVKKGKSVYPFDTRVLYRAHFMDGKTPKIRAVYGYPATMTFGEAQFALPLIEGFKKGTTPIAYDYMISDGAMKLRSDLMEYKYYCCADFRKFDKTVSEQLIDLAFAILMQNINFSFYQDHGIPDASALYRAWEHIIDYFKHTLIRLPNGDRFQKKAGIPSGSYFTQLIGSITNYICLSYAIWDVKGRAPKYIKVFGDNSVIGMNEKVDKFDIMRVIDQAGMELNGRKSVFTDRIDEVEFLGFSAGGFPQRSMNKWMASLYCPEYPDTCLDDFQSQECTWTPLCQSRN